ncbi:pollen receptor-like kinase 5 [Aristolochia californica]|uniref:pollen receptor-like kinase 5 n=1 Tax=Aristolochia californica TaxID=171875 RepID=UPI0035E24F72
MERSKGLILATRLLVVLLVFSGSGAAIGVSPAGEVQNQSAEKEKSNPFAATSLILIFIILDVIAFVLVLLLLRAYFQRRKSDKWDARDLDMENKKNNRPLEHRENTVGGNEERGKLEFLTEEGGFELRDLLKASAEALGKGNFGACYKARLESGASIVVKRLKDLTPFTRDEFAKHMRALSNLKHPNLLSLLAYYNSRDEKLLVYRFAANGNLFDRIHGGLLQLFSNFSQ